MKDTIKMTYEEPKLQVVTFCAQDILANSFDAFFGEEDPLSIDEVTGYNLKWQKE